jgi:hypothetical protein
MIYGPLARIVIRYGVGIVLGANAANIAVGNPDLVTVVAGALGAANEAVYIIAKRKGWTL